MKKVLRRIMASKKVFEIVTWPCSENYQKDPSIAQPPYELIKGPEGPSGLNE